MSSITLSDQSLASPAIPSDQQLLKQVSHGKEDAFTTLYKRHSKGIYTYLVRLVWDTGVAEDLLQEVFFAIWEAAGRFEGRSKVKTWMFQIAHYKAVSWLRKNSKQIASLEDIPEQPAQTITPETAFMRSWSYAQVQEALKQLSPKHRSVIELAFMQDFSYKEISEVVQAPVGTIKSRMRYALLHLNRLLQKRDMGR